MIDKKVALYILLGFCFFALWEAWQKDYGDNQAASVEEPQSMVSEQESFYKKTSASLQVLKDKPQIRIEKTIKATTDVLAIKIDLKTGNVTSADLLKYPEVIYQEQPVRLLDNDIDNHYYIAESGLIGGKLKDNAKKEVTDYYTADDQYVLADGENQLIIKLAGKEVGGVKVDKIFTLTRGKYDLKVAYEITNRSSAPWEGNLYADLKKKSDNSSGSIFQVKTYEGAAISSAEKPYEKISFSEIEKIDKNKNGKIREVEVGGWIAIQQRYFIGIWVPDQNQRHDYWCDYDHGVYSIGFKGDSFIVDAGKQETVSTVLYLGPDTVENVSGLAKGLERTVDYGWLWIISIGLFWILKKIYQLVGNWGVAIILVTGLIKLLFYKFSEASGKSMARIKELMPRIQAIKERYGDDKQKIHQATMELYQREKVNPFNLGGCLPMLIQIPFFIALYYVLIGAVELRHAPFVWWLHDLSAKDPYFILPVLMGLSMVLQQRLTPSTADPAQAKMMMIMPLVFTVFFLGFPSGLVLYWLTNNVLSILQQWYINKKIKDKKSLGKLSTKK